MHAQKATVRAITDAGHDYCIGVKGNQKTLLEKMKKHTQTRSPVDIHVQTEKNRNRFETRTVEVYSSFYGAKKEWAGLKSIVKVTRVRRVPSKNWYGKKTLYDSSIETAYYISSLSSKTPAQEFGEGIRGHWAIENSLHYVKDVTLGEDASRMRTGNAPENMSVIRNIVLNVFHKHGKNNIAESIQMIAGDFAQMREMLGV